MTFCDFILLWVCTTICMLILVVAIKKLLKKKKALRFERTRKRRKTRDFTERFEKGVRLVTIPLCNEGGEFIP